jgi:hypothetical protein
MATADEFGAKRIYRAGALPDNLSVESAQELAPWVRSWLIAQCARTLLTHLLLATGDGGHEVYLVDGGLGT